MTSLRALLAEAGFHGHGLDVAAAVAQAESGGHTHSHNTNSGTGDNSYGLFQINMLGSLGPARRAQYGLHSNNELFDPRVNARIAYEMSDHGTNFGPWTTFTRGLYKQHLGHDIQIDTSGIDPNAATSDDTTTSSHTDTFDISTGQSLTDLHYQQAHEDFLHQIDYVTGHGAMPQVHMSETVTTTAVGTGTVGTGTGTGTAAHQDSLHTFLSAARGELGESYVFGAKASANVAHPHALDCSGLTKWAAERAGAHLPDGAGYQYLALKKAGMLIPVDQAIHTPGALLFHFAAEPRPGQGEPSIAHVAISDGTGRTLEAADDHDGIVSWHAKGRFNYAAVIPGIGTVDPSGDAENPLGTDHVPLDTSHDASGTQLGLTDDLSTVHTWSGHDWQSLGSDLGSGTGTGVDIGNSTPDLGDHGGLDAGHH